MFVQTNLESLDKHDYLSQDSPNPKGGEWKLNDKVSVENRSIQVKIDLFRSQIKSRSKAQVVSAQV